MSWTSLKDRLSQLPLILAGPILRRTESNAVTVWLALREDRKVTLSILDDVLGRIVFSSNSLSPIKLGKNLYVLAITAESAEGGELLKPAENYYYNLTFTKAGESSRDLGDPGILSFQGGIKKITYNDELLPSFALPPEDINDLRIIHGSCRKPHGESEDAFEAIDEIFGKIIKDSQDGRIDPKKRPHLLFLTGDQIYADDVADALLHMLIDAEENLLDWVQPETASFLKRIIGSDFQQELLDPGERAELVEEYAGFTTGDLGKSHLLSLGEFFSMYLFAWSDTLWMTETTQDDTEITVLPTFKQVYPKKFPLFWRKNEFDKEVNALISFRKSISSSVRRILANIPVYMIFDDHEVTDDWYLNLYWVNQVLLKNKGLGKRTIQNGLIAYAIFQAWGNTPKEFSENQVGRTFLDNIVLWSEQERLKPRDQDRIQELLKEIRGQLSIPEKKDDLKPEDLNNDEELKAYSLTHSGNYIKWHYKIVFERSKFEVLVVDTRTWRRYPDIEEYPGKDTGLPELLSLEAYKEQDILAPINSTSELVIFILPAPLIGVPSIESTQKTFGTLFDAYFKDSEAWAVQESSLYRFINQLAIKSRKSGQVGKYLILSGDVHYGFSSKLQYWGENPFDIPTSTIESPTSTDDTKFVLAQLTSSALKNETGYIDGTIFYVIPNPGTKIVHWRGYNIFGDFISPSFLLGWNGPNGSEKQVAQARRETFPPSSEPIPIFISGDPGIIDYFEEKQNSSDGSVELIIKEDWSYRIDYILADFEQKNEIIGPPTDRQSSLKKYVETASNYKDYQEEFGDGKEIVGVNNIGEIIFEWDESKKEVIHRLWWRLESDGELKEPFPLSQYRISLVLNESDRPIELDEE